METVVSVRPRWVNHEIQTADNSECDNPLNVCPFVEDEVDEEDTDDKEEPSEECRGVRGGHTTMMTPTLRERQEHERTHIPFRSWCRHCVAARASNPAHRGRRCATAVEEDKHMKQVTHDYCLMRHQLGSESAEILVSKDSASGIVSACVAQ